MYAPATVAAGLSVSGAKNIFLSADRTVVTVVMAALFILRRTAR